MNMQTRRKDLQNTIARAAKASGRSPSDIHLLAVSKQQPDALIEAALQEGQRCFAENRVQEAQERWTARRAAYPDLQLHLIGPLQSNKVAEAVALFDMIHSLDRPKLAAALAQEMRKTGRSLPCLIQVNTGEEPQKAGILPPDLPGFLLECRDVHGLEIRGLMCIPPQDEPAALHFAFLAKLARRLALSDLSMGMSADFEKAVPLGATYVRIGTAFFQPRT